MNITEEELTKLVRENGLTILNETPARQSVVNVQPIERQNKYHVSAKEDRTYNGITYASKKEAEYAQELDLRVKAGEIDYWIRQVPFVVGYDPVTIYKADFVTFQYVHSSSYNVSGTGKMTPAHPLWEIEVIEVKPKSEKAWAPGAKRKLKLFREKYPNLTLAVV